MEPNNELHSSAIVLANFLPVEPSAPIPQDEARRLMGWAMGKAKCIEAAITSDAEANALFDRLQSKIARYWVDSESIKQRRTILSTSYFSSDAIPTRIKENGVFTKPPGYSPLFHDLLKSDCNPRGACMEERMNLFEKVVGLCLNKIYNGIQDPPDDIIHVTNSGYLSPSPVEKLVSKKEWFNTTVTHSYGMGCYGSLPAIRMAHGFISSSLSGVWPPKSQVDIIHTEIYSAHTKIVDDSPENIVVMSLFGDGIIKYSAYTEAGARQRGLPGLKILALKESLVPNSIDEMTAIPASHGMEMTLSVKVPMSVKKAVKSFARSLFGQIGKDFDKEKERVIFAVHPGGPAIIEYIRRELGLSSRQLELSKKIIYENGNMASVTLPYMFNEIIASDDIAPGTHVLGLAFGPGLTISGVILEKI